MSRACEALDEHFRATGQTARLREIRARLDRHEADVAAAQREGTLRPDVGAGDVTQLFAMVYKTTPTTPDESADLAARRTLAVILDGLRTGERDELPGRPLDASDLERLRDVRH